MTSTTKYKHEKSGTGKPNYLLPLVDFSMSSLSNLVPNEQVFWINKQISVDPGRRRCVTRALFGCHQIISHDLAVPWPPELLAATAVAAPAPVAATAHRVWSHAARRCRRGGGNDVVWVRELAVAAGQPRH
jgi:hypothetical protein